MTELPTVPRKGIACKPPSMLAWSMLCHPVPLEEAAGSQRQLKPPCRTPRPRRCPSQPPPHTQSHNRPQTHPTAHLHSPRGMKASCKIKTAAKRSGVVAQKPEAKWSNAFGTSTHLHGTELAESLCQIITGHRPGQVACRGPGDQGVRARRPGRFRFSRGCKVCPRTDVQLQRHLARG